MRPLCGAGTLLPVGRRFGRESLLSLSVALIVTLVALVDHVACGSVTNHEFKVVAGNSVDIPCDIDLNKCGPVHNIKIYKNGNRVLTYDNSTGVPDQQMAGDLIRTAGPAQFWMEDGQVLHISTVFLLDEGLYRCETTFLKVLESCSNIAFTSVITLAPPSPPQITFSGHPVNMTRIGPINEGTDLILKCESTGKPVVDVTWWNGTESKEGSYSPISETTETEIGLNTIKLAVSRYDLFSRFECQAINEAITTPLKTWIEVDVHVRPLTIDISGPEEPITESDQVTLVCEVTGARPEASISWYHGERTVGPSQPDEILDEENPFTKSTRSTYIFTVSRADNGVKIRCQARNKVIDEKGEVALLDVYTLEVYYKPNVTVVSKLANAAGEMEVEYAHEMELYCQYNANPMRMIEIAWYRNGKLIDFNDTSDEDDVDHDYDDEDRLFYKRGSLNDDNDDDDDNGDDSDDDDNDSDENGLDRFPSLFFKRIMHVDKGVYTCRLGNEVGSELSSNTLTVDVLYPPVMEVTIDPEDIKDDDEINVTLKCNLKTGNPNEADNYRWYKDDELIQESDDDEMVLESVDRDDAGNYTCTAKNKIGWGHPSKPKELIVKYPPGEATMTYSPQIPIKGNSLKLTCSVDDLGVPPATRFRWYRNEIHLADAGKSEYVIKAVAVRTIANFTCTAINEVGEGTQALKFIEIIAAPSFIEELPEVHGVLEDTIDIRLSCRVECNPICNIDWYRNDKLISLKNPLYTIETIHKPIDYEAEHLNSTMSFLIWNMTNWPGGRLDRDKDSAFYKCKSGGNQAGYGVESKTYFQVEYPPEDISVTKEVVDVLFNTEPENVTCEANGVPEPNYIWTFGDEEVSAEAMLNLNFSIPKSQGGNYTCTAFNKHGKQTTTTLINVQYKPECSINKEMTSDGQHIITCEVSANPSDVIFQWFKDDEPLTDDIFTDELESVVRFQEDESRYGLYTCVANNSIGVSEEDCFVNIKAEGGWLESLAENKAMFVTASVVAGVLLMIIVIVVIIVVLCIVKRRAAAKGGSDGKKKDPDSRAFYENLPFHGLQAPPNKPFKPILPDLEYADVDFPAQPMNNNNPLNKAKIVEKVLKDVEDDEVGTGETPVRPPRAKTSTRK